MTFQQVWNDLPSGTIGRGFVLAYRIAKQVVDNKATPSFKGKMALFAPTF
jgi:hypothetical protein